MSSVDDLKASARERMAARGSSFQAPRTLQEQSEAKQSRRARAISHAARMEDRLAAAKQAAADATDAAADPMTRFMAMTREEKLAWLRDHGHEDLVDEQPTE